MSGTLSLMLEGVDSRLDEIQVKEETANELFQDNIHIETPAMDENIEMEMDIKEEVVGFEQIKSKSDVGNFIQDPVPLMDPLNTEESSGTLFKRDIDESVQILLRSGNHVSTTKPLPQDQVHTETEVGSDHELPSPSKYFTRYVARQKLANPQPQVSSRRLCGQKRPYLTTLIGAKTHTCKNCSARFETKFKLRDHNKWHTGEKRLRRRNRKTQFKCSVCEETFSAESILTAHLKTHTGEKPSRSLGKGSWTVEKVDPGGGPKNKYEEMDCHLHHNSTKQAYSEGHQNMDLEKLSSKANVECGCTEAEERDFNDFSHDLLLCERDCETCVKYMRMFSEHLRTTHAPHQPIQDPLLIDPVPVSLTGQTSSSIQIKSVVKENIVKMELDCNDCEDTSGDEFIRESETPLIVDEIEIKHEEMDFHLHDNSTAEVHSEGHSHSSIEQLSSDHFECGSTKAAEEDLNNFYNNLLLCERDCETCLKYMKVLKEHVRAIHAPPQPIQDSLLIHPVLLTDQSSSSILIKSGVDENIVKISESEEMTAPNSDIYPDYDLESDTDSHPDYDPSLPATRKVRRQRQAIAKTESLSSSQSRSSKSKNKIVSSKENFKCGECGKSFKRMIRLKEHVIIHTGDKPFKCELCEKSYLRRNHLIEHMRVHTGQKPFKCDLCEKSFARSYSLLLHKRFHTGEKPFKCNLCEKSFAESCHLTQHKRFHSGDKPFKCDVCEKRFCQSADLTVHKRIHTGERPYQCDVCVMRFTCSSNFTAHKRIHTGVKPFKCDVCEKSFVKKFHLTRHVRTHTGENSFKCDLSSKSFSKKSQLDKHGRIHKGVKPFQCDLCEKSFSKKSLLTTHMRVHTGEKPFLCDLCEKGFAKKSLLTRHVRIHTEENRSSVICVRKVSRRKVF